MAEGASTAHIIIIIIIFPGCGPRALAASLLPPATAPGIAFLHRFPAPSSSPPLHLSQLAAPLLPSWRLSASRSPATAAVATPDLRAARRLAPLVACGSWGGGLGRGLPVTKSCRSGPRRWGHSAPFPYLHLHLWTLLATWRTLSTTPWAWGGGPGSCSRGSGLIGNPLASKP